MIDYISDFKEKLHKAVHCAHDNLKVGQGEVKPKQGNVKAILGFPPHENKRGIKRFLGMIGFYRKFVHNFATIAEPLIRSRLLKKIKKKGLVR